MSVISGKLGCMKLCDLNPVVFVIMVHHVEQCLFFIDLFPNR
jgi:(2Fe-2S) ferredoxin